ncbi:MAG: phosphatase PAP2 family protein [Candidatus Lokiarchaeota archaeon]
MEESSKRFSWKTLLLLEFITVIIAVLGLALIPKFDDAFYVNIPIVKLIFTIITNLGETIVFIILIAIIYIGYDKKFAKNLTFSLLITYYINGVFKDIFKDPRPPSSSITDSYGFPSGHSQTAVGFWGYVGYEFREKPRNYIIPILMAIIITLVALSRLIIGVHDVQDVAGGLILGIGILIVFIYLEPIFTRKFNTFAIGIKIGLGVIVSIGLLFLGIVIFLMDNGDLGYAFADEGAYGQVAGVILGLSIGYILEQEYVKYEPKDMTVLQRILNVIIGLAILLVVYFLLEFLLHGNIFFRFIRYAVIALILTLLLPYIFVKIYKPKRE